MRTCLQKMAVAVLVLAVGPIISVMAGPTSPSKHSFESSPTVDIFKPVNIPKSPTLSHTDAGIQKIEFDQPQGQTEFNPFGATLTPEQQRQLDASKKFQEAQSPQPTTQRWIEQRNKQLDELNAITAGSVSSRGSTPESKQTFQEMVAKQKADFQAAGKAQDLAERSTVTKAAASVLAAAKAKINSKAINASVSKLNSDLGKAKTPQDKAKVVGDFLKNLIFKPEEITALKNDVKTIRTHISNTLEALGSLPKNTATLVRSTLRDLQKRTPPLMSKQYIAQLGNTIKDMPVNALRGAVAGADAARTASGKIQQFASQNANKIRGVDLVGGIPVLVKSLAEKLNTTQEQALQAIKAGLRKKPVVAAPEQEVPRSTLTIGTDKNAQAI